MNKSRGLFLMLAGIILLTTGGCGEFAYKTGAGADALQADELACKQGSSGPAAYSQCMSAKGWSIANFGGDDTQSVAPAPTPAGSPMATAAPPSASASMPAGTAAVSTPAAMAEPTSPSAPDPSAPVHITGWVKFGGSSPGDAIAACVTKLGPANQPDTANKAVTRALLSCMHEQGWRGF